MDIEDNEINVNGIIKEEEKCERCDTPSSKVKLFDAIDGLNIIRVCRECAKLEGLALIKKPTAEQLRNAEKPYTVYERISRIAGLPSQKPRKIEKDVHLDDLRHRASSTEHPLKLVDNFNWKIMRARRARRLSQEKLAELLFESVEAIKMIESGRLPENAGKLITKLEQYFQIQLNLEPEKKEIKPEEIKFDRRTIENLTIGDLRRLQKEREMRVKLEKKDMKAEEVVSEVLKEESEIVGEDIEIEE